MDNNEAPSLPHPPSRARDHRRTFTVTEAALILGISRTTAYECVRTGELQSLRLRSRIVIPAHAIAAMLDSPDPQTAA